MAICVVCHNTGLTLFGDYCRCEHGRKLHWEMTSSEVTRASYLYGILELAGYGKVEPKEEKDIPMDLIDLALQTKDEEWFKQLTRGME